MVRVSKHTAALRATSPGCDLLANRRTAREQPTCSLSGVGLATTTQPARSLFQTATGATRSAPKVTLIIMGTGGRSTSALLECSQGFRYCARRTIVQQPSQKVLDTTRRAKVLLLMLNARRRAPAGTRRQIPARTASMMVRGCTWTLERTAKILKAMMLLLASWQTKTVSQLQPHAASLAGEIGGAMMKSVSETMIGRL